MKLLLNFLFSRPLPQLFYTMSQFEMFHFRTTRDRYFCVHKFLRVFGSKASIVIWKSQYLFLFLISYFCLFLCKWFLSKLIVLKDWNSGDIDLAKIFFFFIFSTKDKSRGLYFQIRLRYWPRKLDVLDFHWNKFLIKFCLIFFFDFNLETKRLAMYLNWKFDKKNVCKIITHVEDS